MGRTERLSADKAGVARAAELLCAGETVAFPTETVYGLGADATNGQAVAKIFDVKERPRFNPLIVHVAGNAEAERLITLPEQGVKLAEAFWPGPLTLAAPVRPEAGIADLVMAGLDTLAVRVAAHPLAGDLLHAAGRPLAAPSANVSGRVSPTSAAHVLDGLDGRIAAVLDGGACPVGLESTIIGFDNGRTVLLRPGGLPVEEIEAVLGEAMQTPEPGVITASGQLESHYAPQARLRLDACGPKPGELWLGFGPGPDGLSLSPSGDLTEAAANLFAHLRSLDHKAPPGQTIAVASIPQQGLGQAINDRLRRAAAPR